jgi:plastocyanin
MRSPVRPLFLVLLSFGVLAGVGSRLSAERPQSHHVLVSIPEQDRFYPFAIQIQAGDTVDWVNSDTDDHTVVSNDALNTANPKNVDVVVLGTVNNGGQPGVFSITFHDSGIWNYYCRFHSMVMDDQFHQPFAPGPRGGIQTEKDPTLCDPPGTDTCNFGTPMMGVITILPHHSEDTVSVAPRKTAD